MIEIFITDEFKRRYQELPKNVQERTEKQEKLFRHNPFYPSLHTEKLEPKDKQVWSFRIDKKYRIFFVSRIETKLSFLPSALTTGFINLNFDTRDNIPKVIADDVEEITTKEG